MGSTAATGAWPGLRPVAYLLSRLVAYVGNLRIWLILCSILWGNRSWSVHKRPISSIYTCVCVCVCVFLRWNAHHQVVYVIMGAR